MDSDQETIRRLFQKPEINNARYLVQEYDFRLEGILTNIRIWLYSGLTGTWIEAEQNYYLQAPGMKEPAVPETQRYRNTEEAVEEILASFLEGYQRAVSAGHVPSSDWLMPAY